MDGFKQSGSQQDTMVVLWLSLGDQALTCSSYWLCLDLFHLGAPWKRVSVTAGSAFKANYLMFNSVSPSKSCILLLIPANLKKFKISAFQTEMGRGCSLYGAGIVRTSAAAWILSSAGETNSPCDQLMQVKDEEQMYL